MKTLKIMLLYVAWLCDEAVDKVKNLFKKKDSRNNEQE